MYSLVLIIPIIALLLMSKVIVPPHVPAPRSPRATVEQMSPFEIRQALRRQKWKEAMKEESVTAGASE